MQKEKPTRKLVKKKPTKDRGLRVTVKVKEKTVIKNIKKSYRPRVRINCNSDSKTKINFQK